MRNLPPLLPLVIGCPPCVPLPVAEPGFEAAPTEDGFGAFRS